LRELSRIGGFLLASSGDCWWPFRRKLPSTEPIMLLLLIWLETLFWNCTVWNFFPLYTELKIRSYFRNPECKSRDFTSFEQTARDFRTTQTI
jgi:hypothetical protein